MSDDFREREDKFWLNHKIYGYPPFPEDCRVEVNAHVRIFPDHYILNSHESQRERICTDHDEGWRELTWDERNKYHFHHFL